MTRTKIGSRWSAAVAVALLCALAAGPAPAATAPGLFRVGAAWSDVTPSEPVYVGGADAGPPVTAAHDHLYARALYVSDGTHATAIAVVDSQGMFAAYQQDPALGVDDIRRRAAAEITRVVGQPMSAKDIVVQATHSHAAPTLEGIWGPVSRSYLKLVHDRTIDAIVAAAQANRRAYLRLATVDASALASIDVAQNSFPGWAIDPYMQVLQALDPSTGETIAVFAAVPFHPAIALGADVKQLSADFPGVARRELERELGGVAIVAPATLGRMQAPVENGKTASAFDNVDWYGKAVANMVIGALHDGRWVGPARVAATEQALNVPATNAALLGLNDAWALPNDQKQQMLDQSGVYPIDRANTPPYRLGNVITTPLTAVRIGNVALLAMPGEPFPEIRYAIAPATSGSDTVIALSKAQDDLGYFYPAWAWPFGLAYPTDTGLFSVAPQMGDQVIQAELANMSALGFGAQSFALALPMDNRYDQVSNPALQAIASPATGDIGTDGTFATRLEAIYSPAVLGGHPLQGKVHWSFGDGTSADSGYLDREPGGLLDMPHGSSGEAAIISHSYASPGTYAVVASGVDSGGTPVSRKLTVRVLPALHVAISAHVDSADTVTFTASASGGTGSIAAWRWRFGDGTLVRGLHYLHHKFAPGSLISARLAGTDYTGTIARARWSSGKRAPG